MDLRNNSSENSKHLWVFKYWHTPFSMVLWNLAWYFSVLTHITGEISFNFVGINASCGELEDWGCVLVAKDILKMFIFQNTDMRDFFSLVCKYVCIYNVSNDTFLNLHAKFYEKLFFFWVFISFTVFMQEKRNYGICLKTNSGIQCIF